MCVLEGSECSNKRVRVSESIKIYVTVYYDIGYMTVNMVFRYNLRSFETLKQLLQFLKSGGGRGDDFFSGDSLKANVAPPPPRRCGLCHILGQLPSRLHSLCHERDRPLRCRRPRYVCPQMARFPLSPQTVVTINLYLPLASCLTWVISFKSSQQRYEASVVRVIQMWKWRFREVKSPAQSHSWEEVGLGYELKQSDSRAHILKHWAALLPGEIPGLQAGGGGLGRAPS